VLAGVVEQARHRLEAVVARDLHVDVLPDPLDAVRVGAVWHSELEQDAALELLDDASGRVGRADAVGVDDQVGAPNARAAPLIEQL
jgi:hypothetical protein